MTNHHVTIISGKRRLFRLSNKTGAGCWVLAADVAAAKKIFLDRGRVRKIENITKADDHTDFYLQGRYADSLRVLLASGKSGICSIRIQSARMRPVVEGSGPYGWECRVSI